MGVVERNNGRLVAAFYQLLSSGDIDEAFDLLDDALEWVVPESLSLTPLGKEVVRDRSRVMHVNSNGTYRAQPVAMTAEGDRVAVEGRTSATLNNGRTFDDKYHYLFIVKDNKVMRVEAYHDTAHVKAAMRPDTPPKAKDLSLRADG